MPGGRLMHCVRGCFTGGFPRFYGPVREYRRIAAASTFSPRFLPVLAEAGRVTKRFGVPLHVIHAAAETAEKSDAFRQAFRKLCLPADTRIIWVENGAPAEAILEAVKEAGIELLIAGALERDSEHRHFTGGVARSLLRNIPCDLLLLTEPRQHPSPWKKIVAHVSPTGDAPHLAGVFELAAAENAAEVCLITVITPFDKIRNGEDQQTIEERIDNAFEGAGAFKGTVDLHVVRSNTGFSLCDAVQSHDADLFVVCLEAEENGNRMPTHMDWLYQVIPSDLWILKST